MCLQGDECEEAQQARLHAYCFREGETRCGGGQVGKSSGSSPVYLTFDLEEGLPVLHFQLGVMLAEQNEMENLEIGAQN